jgi:hypothetical protein
MKKSEEKRARRFQRIPGKKFGSLIKNLTISSKILRKHKKKLNKPLKRLIKKLFGIKFK